MFDQKQQILLANMAQFGRIWKDWSNRCKCILSSNIA